jgi:hypothetical protein
MSGSRRSKTTTTRRAGRRMGNRNAWGTKDRDIGFSRIPPTRSSAATRGGWRPLASRRAVSAGSPCWAVGRMATRGLVRLGEQPDLAHRDEDDGPGRGRAAMKLMVGLENPPTTAYGHGRGARERGNRATRRRATASRAKSRQEGSTAPAQVQLGRVASAENGATPNASGRL